MDKLEIIRERGGYWAKNMGCSSQRSHNGICEGRVNVYGDLGRYIRYIQSTGSYCYYYKGGTSSGKSGPNTWRYDPR